MMKMQSPLSYLIVSPQLAREQQQADDPQFDTAIQDVTDRDFAQVSYNPQTCNIITESPDV